MLQCFYENTQILAPRTIHLDELCIADKIRSTYLFTDLVLPMDPFPYVNVPQHLRLEGLSEQERLQRLNDFSNTTRGLSHAASAALRAGKYGGVLHPGINRISLLGEAATIISRADDETTAARSELAINLERAVGGFTFGLISILPQETYDRL